MPLPVPRVTTTRSKPGRPSAPRSVHDYAGERQYMLLCVWRSEDPLGRRQVDHIDPAIKPGDLIVKGETCLDARTWLVVKNVGLPRTKQHRWWRATLVTAPPAVTVAGVTHRAAHCVRS